MGNIV